MSGPLPLRLCCMAAMAPALTEAATQAKIKLPETSAAASSDLVSRQSVRQPVRKQGHLGIPKDKIAKIVTPFGTVAHKPVSHLNGDSHRSVDKPSVFASLQRPLNSVKVSANIKDLVRTDRSNSFQNEFLRAIRTADGTTSGKVQQIMNKPSPGGLDNEEGKCRGESIQNGSHSLSLTDIGKSAGINTGVVQQTQAGSRQSQTLDNSAKNMCRKLGEGDRAVPNTDTTNSNSGPSPGGSQTNRQVPTMVVSQPLSGVSSPDSNVDAERMDEGVQNARAEAAKKQAQLERRIEFLLRRIRRAQGRQVEVHMRQQLVGYEQYQVQNLQTVAKTVSTPTPSNESSSDLKKELLSDGVKNLSTAALVSLVHRMQASTNSFQQQPHSVKPEVTSVLTMAEDVRKESKVTADKLSMNLNFMQSALDSDATESSSGGESGDDECSEGLDLPVPTTPLVRRAEWKWVCERAAVASRWTWLQAQVSDLEYRIRQQSEIYRQARHSKGQVVLGEPPLPQDHLRITSQGMLRAGGDVRSGVAALASSVAGTEVSPCNVSAVLSNVDKQANRLTQSLNCLSPANTSPASSVGSTHPKSRVSSPAAAPNGMIDSPMSSASVDVEGTSPLGVGADLRVAMDTTDLSPVLDMTCRAARCLPLKYQLRKRKLLRTCGLHLRSAKAAKLSSVKCHCHPPVTPCVLCGGRLNSVQAVDPDSMPYQERVALLDPSNHQVLSFPEEVPLSVHFEALLRSGEWQNKPPIRRPRMDQGQRRQKYIPGLIDGRKKQFRKNAASVIIQSAKIRNKYDQKTGRKPGPQRGKRLSKRALNAELKRRRNPQFGAAGMGMKRKNMKGLADFFGSSMDTPAGSPLPRDAATPVGSQKEKEVRKRRGESAYDINNIVIPHSMASLTRVEKLEYKEIPIPSWRVISGDLAEEETVKEEVLGHKSNGLIANITAGEDETEDLSDEAFILRHKVCEAEEKNRFSNFVQYPPTRRNRTQSMVSIHGTDPAHHDGTRPATPSTPNLAVSMGTQASLDAGDFAGEEAMDMPMGAPAPVGGASVPSFSLGPPDEDSCSLHSSGGLQAFSVPRRGSMSASQRDRLSLGSSMDDGEVAAAPNVPPWPQRQFPLSEEELESLKVEDVAPRESKRQMNLSVVSGIGSLRPQPVEGASQAGSSASGSLPASPMPSSSSTSAVGDYDAADPEWVAEAESSKRMAGQHKAIKR